MDVEFFEICELLRAFAEKAHEKSIILNVSTIRNLIQGIDDLEEKVKLLEEKSEISS